MLPTDGINGFRHVFQYQIEIQLVGFLTLEGGSRSVSIRRG
jgi:hypothetical protein